MALYYPPVKPNAPIYSYQNFALPNTPVSPAQGGSSVTPEWLSTHYLQFPNAQGVENFGFQELNLTNTNIGESATLYLNPSATEDVTLLSNQNNGGLTVRSPNASFTLNPYPIASGIVGAQTLNPIDMNGYGLYGLTNVYADSSGMTFIDSSNTPLLQLTNGGHTSYENINMNYNDINNINNIYFGGNNCSISNQSDFNPNVLAIANNAPIANSPLIYFQMLNGSGTPFSPLNIAYNNISVNSSNMNFINTDIYMDTNSNINGINGGNNTIDSFNLTNSTATTQPLNTNNTSIATCEFVLANQGTPTDLSNYAQKTYSTLQTFTGPITFTGTVNSNAYNINTYSVIDQSGTNNGTVISNNAPYVGGAQATIGFNLNSSTGTVSPFQIYSNGLNSTVNLNMNNANINGINTLTGYGGGNITLGSYINMNSNNILSMGSASTAYTQPIGTNNTTVATTAYVQQNGPQYYNSSYSLNSSSTPYFSLNPSSQSVITTYTYGNNTASFNSSLAVLTITNSPGIGLVQLEFTPNPPFPNSPPNPSSQNISIYCPTNGVTYTCSFNWIDSNSVYLSLPTGVGNLNVGVQYNINLATIGAFTP
jgi:hypothetical protein